MVTKKKTTTRKAASAAAAPKPPTKSEILAHIAEETGMARKDVSAVFDSLQGLMKKNLGRRGPGIFSMPGLMKIKVQTKPATKARKGINPFTGEEQMFKAKPARKTVKIQALKTLKDMV
ncbi:MAG: HU family DNA-binding protein [Pseudomonadota bacterium]